MDGDTADFVHDVCTKACQAEAVDEAADWLWAHWLLTGETERTNSIIEADVRMGSRFGIWRAPPDDSPVESTPVLTYSEEQPTAADVVIDNYASLFAELRSEVQRAEETVSAEPLLAAKAIIEGLIERLEARDTAQTETTLTMLREMVLQMRSREAPTDTEAAARRKIVMDRLAVWPLLAPTEALATARDIKEKIGWAEEAKQAFELAEAAHLVARFDLAKLQAYNDAITRYGEAERSLTVRLEELANAAALTIPFDPIQSTNGEQGHTHSDATPPAEPSSHEGISGEPGPAQQADRSVAPEEGVSATSAADDNEETATSRLTLGLNERDGSTGIAVHEAAVNTSPEEKLSAPNESVTKIADANAAADLAQELGASELDPNETVETTEGEPAHLEPQAFAVAERLLYQGHLGLFSIACDVGRELGYKLPRPEVAVMVGTSGLTEPLRQLRFTDAVNFLLTDCDLGQLGSGEVCLLFAALCLPAMTDPTFISRNVLSRLKLEHADFSAAIALRKTIEELGRAYSGVEAFLSSGGADPEEEFRNARAAAQQAAGAIKMKTVNYHAATMVAHRLAQELAQATEQDSANIDAFIQGLDKAFPPDHDDDEAIRRLDRELRADKAERKPIEARALTSLKNIVREVREVTKRLGRAASVLREQRRSGPLSREATYRKGRDLRGKFKLVADEFRNLSVVWDSHNRIASAGARVAAILLDTHGR